MARRPVGRILGAIVENMREAALGIDREGRITIINQSAEALLADAKQPSTGKYIWDAVESKELVRAVASIIKDADPQPLEQVFTFEDNRIFIVKIIPVPDSDGRVMGAVAILEDITQFQRVEDTVNEFVATVSHELKTPLTSIKGFVETLLEGALSNPEITRRFLQVINEETNRLTRLVINLLDLTKVIKKTAGGEKMIPVNTSLFIREAVRLFEPMAMEKQLRIISRIPENLPPIQADTDRLRQVIINLVDNAIKYTGVRGPGGTVEIEAHSKNGLLSVNVSDSGIGIPEDEQEKIFEKFYRISQGPASQLGGTGLGLAITKEIIEGHGGKISVKSTPGAGAVFSFSIPICPEGG